jgi:NADH:ubiquinone oxidoreductase subunit 3 (subunit A)
MLTAEFLIAFFMFLQPPIFGFLFFSIVRTGLVGSQLFSFLKTSRRRLKSVKFFECAAYPRLLNAMQYDIFVLSFCILFILYDVDLIFFFTEAVCVES